MNISEKLKLIKEGYTIDQINNGQILNESFSNIPQETNFISETSLFFESINTDLEFITEAAVGSIMSSSLDKIKEKISKFVDWMITKIKNIINWIKANVKNKEDQKLLGSVKEKVKNIDLPNMDSEIVIYEKFINGSPSLMGITHKLVDVIEKALNNFGHGQDYEKIIFSKNSMLQGITNRDVDNQRDVTVEIMRYVTDSKLVDVREIGNFYYGQRKQVPIKSLNHSTIENLINLLERKDFEDISKTYEIFTNKLKEWEGTAKKLLDENKLRKFSKEDVSDDKVKFAQRKISQFIMILNSVSNILNNITHAEKEAVFAAREALKRIDSYK